MATLYQKPKANVIKASFRLMQKVGMGPLPEDVLARCEAYIKDNDLNFMPWALSCIRDLNAALGKAVAQGAELDDIVRQDLIAPIMQLKASGAMFKNAPLSQLASMLLHFLESIPRLDTDVIAVVQANETVLGAFLRDKEPDVMTQEKRDLIVALQAACNRYAAKNNLGNLF